MKKLFSILFTGALCGALLLSTAPVQAEMISSYKETTVLNGGTNIISAVTTNRFYTIAIPKAESVALGFGYKFHAAPSAGDATSIRLEFYRGTAQGFETNSVLSWVVAGNSTTPVYEVTNLTLYGVPYLRARVINYGTNAIGTNLTFVYGFKN